MSQGQAKSPTFLIKQIESKAIEPKSLTSHQRKICVRYFIDEKPEVTEHQMAEFLGTSRASISRYKKQVIRQDGWIVDKLDPRLYMVHLCRITQTRINKISQAAVNDPKLWEKAHNLEMELCEKLMDLGFLSRLNNDDPDNLNSQKEFTLQEILKLASESERPLVDPLNNSKEEGANGNI